MCFNLNFNHKSCTKFMETCFHSSRDLEQNENMFTCFWNEIHCAALFDCGYSRAEKLCSEGGRAEVEAPFKLLTQFPTLFVLLIKDFQI